MGVTVSGQGGGLNFTANLDISQAISNAKKLNKALGELTVGADGVTKATASQTAANNTAGKSVTAYQQKQLELRKTLIDSQAASEALRQKNLELDASYKAGKITAQELAASERQLKKDRLALAEATKAARQAQVAATGSYDEASNRLKELGRSIRSAEGGFTSTSPLIRAQIVEYNALNNSLKAFDAEMGNHQRNVGGYSQALNGVGMQLKSLALNYISAYAALAEVIHIIKTNAEISDSFADVRRTAGLTAIEIDNLADSLKKIDTRTSLKGLLDIAVIGGQLGIAKDQLAGFTKAIDQLSVTLSGEIPGGAEAVASSLGKINGVFKVQEREGTNVEESFNKTGSAILELGQAGLATGDFLQDFGLRTAGVANTAKISLPVILAYGAVLEETGSRAEVAGSALAKLIGNLASKREQFFAIARIADASLTLKSFTDLINTDANAALQKFFQGLNAGGKDLTSFTDLIDKIGLRGGPAKNAIIALAQNQALLNERINESKTAYDAGTLSAQQFAIKNNDLAGSIDKLENSITKLTTSGKFADFFQGLIDYVRHAIDIFREFDKVAGAIKPTQSIFRSSGEDKRAVANDINDSFAKSQAGLNSVTDPFSQDPKVLTKNIGVLTQAYKEAYHAYRVYYDGIRSGQVKESDQAGQTLADFKKNAEDILQVGNNVVKRYNTVIGVKKENIKVNNEEADSELKTAAAIHKRIKELQDDAIGTPDNKANDVARIQALKARLKDVSGDKESKAVLDSELKARNALQKSIDDLVKKGTNKELTADEQELESTKKLYADKLAEAVQYNKNQEKLDAENRRKGLPVKGLRVDGGAIIQAGAVAQDAVRDKQATEKLKITLDKQKKLYDDYEAYKNEVGEDNAKKRYAGLIDTDKTYLQSLKAQEQALGPDAKAKGGSDVDAAATQLQKKELDKRIADETYAEALKYDTLLKQLQNYQTQAKILTANYQADQAKIASNPLNLNAEQLAEQYKTLKEKFDKNISQLSVKELTDSVDWSNLFSNLDDLAGKDIETLLKAIEAKFKTLSKTLSPIDLATVRKKLLDAQDALIRDNPFKQVGVAIKAVFADGADGAKKSATQIKIDWNNLGKATAGAFKFVNDAVQSCDILKDALGDVAGTALSSLAAVAAVAISTAAAIKTAEKASVILAVISAALVVVQAIASVFKSIFGAHDKHIEKTIQGYQKDLDTLDKGFKQLERDVSNAVGNDVYADQTAEIVNLQAQQAKLIQQRDAEASKKKADQSKIDDYNDKINDIPNQIDDINKAISENLIQGTFRQLSDSLADALTNAFQAGEDGIDAMDKVFNDFIGNAIKNSLKLVIFDKDIKAFTDDLTDYAKAHDNSVTGYDYSKWDAIFKNDGEQFDAALKANSKYFPSSSDSGSSTDSALNKSISSITSDQANALEGIQRGQYDQAKQLVSGQAISNALLTNVGKTVGDLYQAAQGSFAQLVMINANTKRGADNTDGIAATLKNIETNTKPTSLRGAGLG